MTGPVAHRCDAAGCGVWACCHVGAGEAAAHFCADHAPDDFWPGRRHNAAATTAAAPEPVRRGPAQGRLL